MSYRELAVRDVGKLFALQLRNANRDLPVELLHAAVETILLLGRRVPDV
jgi:hypothetical protein